MRLRSATASLALMATLAGCGHVPAPSQAAGAAPSQSTAARLSSAKLDAAGRADQFTSHVKSGFSGRVEVQGALVTLTPTQGSAVVYDFTDAPRTEMVKVSSDGFTTTVSNARLIETASGPALSDKFLPVMVVTVAIDVAFGGAKALAFYWLTHRDDFNRDDAIKACVVGMASALLDFVPYGQYFEWLVPIAVDILSQVKTGDFKEIAAIAMKDVDKIVTVVKQILHVNMPAQAVSSH